MKIIRSKGLEALEKIKKEYFVDGRLPLIDRVRFELIEKELKALEIIKAKASIDLLEELNDDEPHWLDIGCSTKLTQEEYDLLKDVLS